MVILNVRQTIMVGKGSLQNKWLIKGHYKTKERVTMTSYTIMVIIDHKWWVLGIGSLLNTEGKGSF